MIFEFPEVSQEQENERKEKPHEIAFRMVMRGEEPPALDDSEYKKFLWLMEGKDPEAEEKKSAESEKEFVRVLKDVGEMVEADKKRREEAKRNGTYDYLTEEEFENSEWSGWSNLLHGERSLGKIKELVAGNIRKNIRELKKLDREREANPREYDYEEYYGTSTYLTDLLTSESPDFAHVFIEEFLNDPSTKRQDLQDLLYRLSNAFDSMFEDGSLEVGDTSPLIVKIYEDINKDCKEYYYLDAFANEAYKRALHEGKWEQTPPFELCGKDTISMTDGGKTFLYSLTREKREVLFQLEKNWRELDQTRKMNFAAWYTAFSDDEKQTYNRRGKLWNEIREKVKENKGLQLTELLQNNTPNLNSDSGIKETIEHFEELFINGTVTKERFSKDFGIDLNSCTIQEQFIFFVFLENANEEKVLRLRKFCAAFSMDGFRNFLSLEKEGKEFGDKILSFGEKMIADGTPEVAKRVFETFGQFADVVAETGVYVESLFKESAEKPNISEEALRKIKDDALTQGSETLRGYLEAEKPERIEERTTQMLQNSKLLLNSLRTLKEASGTRFNFNEIVGTSYEAEDAAHLKAEDKGKIKSLLEAAFGNDKAVLAEVMGEFDEAFDASKNPGGLEKNIFHILRLGEEISGLCYTTPNKYKGFQHLNFVAAKEEIRNLFATTKFFFEGPLEAVAQKNAVKAECDPTWKVCPSYIEWGFVILNYRSDGKLVDMVRNDNKKYIFETKDMTMDELRRTRESHVYVRSNLTQEEADTEIGIRLTREGKDGMVLTRYIKEDSGITLAFEKVSPDQLAEFEKFQVSSNQSAEFLPRQKAA